MPEPEKQHWFVCYTKPRWEKKLAAKLTKLGYDVYAPLHKVRRKWSDRYKVIELPLFTGYIFVSAADSRKWALLDVPGIMNFVRHENKPAIVPEKEINRIKRFLQEFDEVNVVENEKLEKDSRVVVSTGVFMDYKGIVLEVRGNKARVQIQTLGVSLEAVFSVNQLMSDT